MRLFGKHIFRSMLKEPLRPCLIALISAVCAAVIIISALIPRTVYENKRADVGAFDGAADIVCALKGDSKVRIVFDDDIRAVLGDRAEVLGEFGFTAFINGGAVSVGASELLSFDRFYEPEYTDYCGFTNRNLKSSAIISERFAASLGIGAGDSFTVRLMERELCYRVGAVAANKGPFAVRDLIVDISGARELLSERSPIIASLGDELMPYSRVYIRLADPAKTADIKAELERTPELSGMYFTAPKTDGSVDFTTTLSTVSLAIPALMLITVSAFLVAAVFELLQKKRRADLALFRMAGASSGQMKLMVILEGGIYGTTGGIVGSLLAVPCIAWAGRVYGFDDPALEMSFIDAALGIFGALVFSLLSVSIFIFRDRKDAANTDEAAPVSDKGALARLLILTVPALFLIISLLCSPKWKYLPALVALISAIGAVYILSYYLPSILSRLLLPLVLRLRRPHACLVLALKSLRASHPVRHTGRLIATVLTVFFVLNASITVAASQSDIFAEFDSSDYVSVGLDEKSYEGLSDIEGVLGACRVKLERDTVFGGALVTGACYIGDARTCLADIPLPTTDPEGCAVAISSGVARSIGVRLGDSLDAEVSGINTRFTVSEIFPSHLDLLYYDAEYVGIPVESICITTDGDEKTAERVAAYTAVNGAALLSGDALFENMVSVFAPHIRVLRAALYLNLSITLIGICCAVLDGYRARAGELSILRSVGCRVRDIRLMQVLELALMLISALAVAIPVSYLLCRVIDLGLTSFGMMMFV